MPYPGLLHPEPLHLQQSTADLCRRHSNTVLAQSLWCLWVLVCTKFVWALWHLWWVWGMILNVILPLLRSCCDFSFAPGCGVSFLDGIQHSSVDVCDVEGSNHVCFTHIADANSVFISWISVLIFIFSNLCPVSFNTTYCTYFSYFSANQLRLIFHFRFFNVNFAFLAKIIFYIGFFY